MSETRTELQEFHDRMVKQLNDPVSPSHTSVRLAQFTKGAPEREDWLMEEIVREEAFFNLANYHCVGIGDEIIPLSDPLPLRDVKYDPETGITRGVAVIKKK